MTSMMANIRAEQMRLMVRMYLACRFYQRTQKGYSQCFRESVNDRKVMPDKIGAS